MLLGRIKLKELMKEFHQSEQDIKALQTVGQMIGEVIKALDEEKCNISFGIFFSYLIFLFD